MTESAASGQVAYHVGMAAHLALRGDPRSASECVLAWAILSSSPDDEPEQPLDSLPEPDVAGTVTRDQVGIWRAAHGTAMELRGHFESERLPEVRAVYERAADLLAGLASAAEHARRIPQD